MMLSNPKQLKTKWWGKNLVFRPSTGSTNNDLKTLGKEGAEEGYTVVADTQTNGRGRYDRTWFSPPGVNLYFSTLLRPQKEIFEIASLTVVAAVALHEFATKLIPGEEFQIKWPNDLLYKRKKVAGLLTELCQDSGEDPFVVLGLGLNVNCTEFPPELEKIAISLGQISGSTFDREDLFAQLSLHLETWYERWTSEGFSPIRNYWVQKSGMVGEAVRLNGDDQKRGVVTGLSDRGGLLVELPSGEIEEVKSGEVEIISN